MDTRIYDADEAEALAEAATQGPWRWRSFPGDACDAIWSGPDEGEGAVCVLSLGYAEPYEEYYGEVYTAADADLLAAAPDLARSVAHHARRAASLEAEVARLRAIIAAERGIAAPNRVTGRESAAQEAWDRQAELLDGARRGDVP